MLSNIDPGHWATQVFILICVFDAFVKKNVYCKF